MRCPRLVRDIAGVTFGVLLLAANAGGQVTTRVSVSSSGLQGDSISVKSAISADGRLVAFSSDADNLVPADTNNTTDVFVHDRATGVTERVSVDSSGLEGDGLSREPAISADGRFVAFTSDSDNLVPIDRNYTTDVFVHDRLTGATERVSLDSFGNEANGPSNNPSLSSDGSNVAFTSFATNLDQFDLNFAQDVFARDRGAGTTERVSVTSSGREQSAYSYCTTGNAISADGNVVVFWSGGDFDGNDTNYALDVFVHDRTTDVTERISVDSSGIEGDDDSASPSISEDGQLVAFQSAARNLVHGDTNLVDDVFVHDRTSGVTERVSVDSSGTQGNLWSDNPSISADGRSVAFGSNATNLVAADTNRFSDVFVHDRPTGITARASVDSAGVQGNDQSGLGVPALSADGWVVAFDSYARNLVAGDTNKFPDVFVHERCSTPASWSNYGSGYPGTFGIPSFTSRQNPVLGTTITLDLANSYQAPTLGLLLVGFLQTNLPTNRGGQLLVVSALIVPISFSSGADSFSGDLPLELGLCGSKVELQAVEADPGAAFGFSFSAGLELVLGI